MSGDSSDYKTLICIENAEIISYRHNLEYISSAFSANQDDNTPDLLTVKREIVTVLDDGISSKQGFDRQLSSEHRSKVSPSSRKLLAVGTFQVYEFNGLIYMSCGRGRSISSANITLNSGNNMNNTSSASSTISNGNNLSVSSNAFVYPLLPKLRIFRLDEFEFVLALFFPQRFWRIRFDVMYQPSNNETKDYERGIGYQIAGDDGFDKEILIKQVDLLQRIFEKYCNFKDLSSAECIANGRVSNNNISNNNHLQKSRTRNRFSKLFKSKSKKLVLTSEAGSNSVDNDISVLSASPDYLSNLIDEKVEKKLRTLQTGTKQISHKNLLSEDKRSTNTEEVYSNLTDSTTAATSFATNGNLKLGNSVLKKNSILSHSELTKRSENMDVQENYSFDDTKQISNDYEANSCFSSHESAYDVLQKLSVNLNTHEPIYGSVSIKVEKPDKNLKKMQASRFADEEYDELNEEGFQFHRDLNEDLNFRGDLSKKLNNEVVRDILEMKKLRNNPNDEQYIMMEQGSKKKGHQGSLRKLHANQRFDNQNILYSKSTEWMDFNDQADEKENKLDDDQDIELDNVLINFSINDAEKKNGNPGRRIPKIEYEPSHHRKLKMRDEVQSYYSTRSFRSLKCSNRVRNPTEQVTGTRPASKNSRRTQNVSSQEKSTEYFGNADYRSAKFFANDSGKYDFRKDGALSEAFTTETGKNSNYTSYRRLVQHGMMLTNEEIFNLVVDEDGGVHNLKESKISKESEISEDKNSGFLTRYFGW